MDSILRWCSLAACLATAAPAFAQSADDAAAPYGELTIRLEDDQSGADLSASVTNPFTLKLTNIVWTNLKVGPPAPKGQSDPLTNEKWTALPFYLEVQTNDGPYRLTVPVTTVQGAISRLRKERTGSLVAVLFVARTGDGQKLAHGFGPDNVNEAAVTVESAEAGDVRWGALRLMQYGAIKRDATFIYDESLFRFPYVVLCMKACSDDQLADVRNLLLNADFGSRPSHAAPGDKRSAPTNVADRMGRAVTAVVVTRSRRFHGRSM